MTTNTEFEDCKVTLKQIQQATGLSLSYLRRLTREGKLKGERIGREYIYSAGEANRCFDLDLKVRKPKRKIADL